MREFRSYNPSTRMEAILTVASYVSQTAAAIALGYWILQWDFTVLSVSSLLLIIVFIGTRLRGFNNIVHECSHFTFCERRPVNVWLGSLCACFILSSFKTYREEHLTHHAHLGDYAKDRDLSGIRDLRLEDPLDTRAVMRHLLNVLFCRHLKYYVSINLSAQDGLSFSVVKIAIISGALIFSLFDPVAAALLIWAPYILVFSAINYFTDCIDHGGLIEANDELESSRNMVLPRYLRIILFPRNDCFHLVHHLFPQVPAKDLDVCHEQLMGHPIYRARMAGTAFSATLDTRFARKDLSETDLLPS